MVPRSLEIPLCYNPAEDPLCHGGFADVWKGRYQDREVAAKVLRVYSRDDPRPIRRVGYKYSRIVISINSWLCLVEVLQGGCGMEHTPSSKHTAALGCNNVRESLRDGIGVDGKGKHQ